LITAGVRASRMGGCPFGLLQIHAKEKLEQRDHHRRPQARQAGRPSHQGPPLRRREFPLLSCGRMMRGKTRIDWAGWTIRRRVVQSVEGMRQSSCSDATFQPSKRVWTDAAVPPRRRLSLSSSGRRRWLQVVLCSSGRSSRVQFAQRIAAPRQSRADRSDRHFEYRRKQDYQRVA
jgi:hypothetical protein